MAKTGQKGITLESSEDWDGMIQQTKRLLQKDKSIVIGEIDIDLEVCSSYTFLILIFMNYIFLSSIFRPSAISSVLKQAVQQLTAMGRAVTALQKKA